VTPAETAPDDDEVDYLAALLSRQSAILTGVANALRGDPGPLASHSHHDLAERAAAMVAELATLRAVRMVPMTPTALDAACAAEDRATVDESLLDGTDFAHPAWWRGHDRATEVWRERVATAERERDEARAAAAGVLTALEAPAPVWDADESDHDAHAARLTDAVEALRSLVSDATVRAR
jgi:hypothetical protein